MSTLEIRIYIWLFLLICIVKAFGILRIYNAVVGNSRFLNVVRQGLQKYISDLKRLASSLEITINQNSSRLSNVNKITSSLEKLAEAIKQFFSRESNNG